MATTDSTPYDSAKRLINASAIPPWMNDYDGLRYASYDLYENIYWTEPGTFRLQQRGNDENAIYVPSGRIITNTINRYTGRDFKCIVDPVYGTDSDKAAIQVAFDNLFKRERLYSQHKTNKLYGIMRGDSFWYIQANPNKPQGSRITVRPLDPRLVFPINPTKDVDRIIGYDIVEQTVVGETTYVSRTRYLKPEHPDHPQTGNAIAPVSYQVELLETENWETEPKVATVVTPVVLMAGITQLPIYHIKNQEEPGNPFGRSEMSGLERLFAGINQSISDEELTLALHGLGMYTSDKGQPRDQNGNPTNWVFGPGRVIHDETLKRIQGVTTVTPYLEHVRYLEERAHQVNGASDVARGIVDVGVAESGIALSLRMGPIIDAAADKNTLIKEVYDNLLYDLREWFAAYEGLNFNDARMVASFSNELPKNKDKIFAELVQMVTADPPLITMAYFRDAARELGHEIPADVNGLAIAEELRQFKELSGTVDVVDSRLDEEINAADTGDDGEEV